MEHQASIELSGLRLIHSVPVMHVTLCLFLGGKS